MPLTRPFLLLPPGWSVPLTGAAATLPQASRCGRCQGWTAGCGWRQAASSRRLPHWLLRCRALAGNPALIFWRTCRLEVCGCFSFAEGGGSRGDALWFGFLGEWVCLTRGCTAAAQQPRTHCKYSDDQKAGVPCWPPAQASRSCLPLLHPPGWLLRTGSGAAAPLTNCESSSRRLQLRRGGRRW